MPHREPRPPRTITDDAAARELLEEHKLLRAQRTLTAAEVQALRDLLKTGYLQPKELESVREMLEADRFWKRAWSTIKTWVVSVGAVVAAGTIGLGALKSAVKALTGD